MTIDSKTYHVPPGKKLELSEWPTAGPALTKSKKHYQQLLEDHVKDLSALQQLHYASNRHALLLIFQGIDAGEYLSEKVTPKDFERLAEEAGLGKPLVKQRVPEMADAVIGALGKIKIANPVAEAVAALIRAHCETMRNSFRR